jgi:predicted dienelactone hydrolase
MSRQHRFGALAISTIALVILASCGSTSESPARGADQDPAAQFAEAAQAGPFAVGLRTITVTDAERDGRSFQVDIWYPVNPDAADGVPAAEYSFIPGLGYTSEVSLADAPAADGPFPLVIYSHGSGGFRWAATNVTEFLASRGFVVAAPDHPGNTALDAFTGSSTDTTVTANNRPGDISATIDALLAASADSSNPLAGRVDGEQIAVTGHSFGGFTSLATASGHTNAVGTTTADPRVRAVVAFAPATRMLSDAELGAVDLPTLLVSGTLDETTPIENNTTRPWDLVTGRPLLRVDITGAPHNSFADVCQLQEKVGQIPDVPPAVTEELDRRATEACAPQFLAYTEVQRITNAYTAAFLARHLSGSEAFTALLACSSPPADAVCSVRD